MSENGRNVPALASLAKSGHLPADLAWLASYIAMTDKQAMSVSQIPWEEFVPITKTSWLCALRHKQRLFLLKLANWYDGNASYR